MLSSNHSEQFDGAYKGFCSFCDNGHKSVRLHVHNNWKDCRKMWSNYLRNKVFSAGNTTSCRLSAALTARKWKRGGAVLRGKVHTS
ncbi:hypothetical protein PC116_g16579 [Phytophthora cactorum]|uniref:Uncharacterized protein n=1 Tax=Phytophthora cactorum TaxID=29920 RepID=A0A8T1KIU1_9STRA|nr:hypothetical protein PC112_g12811 [Phytophthora cactorum]KAG2855929.1 hypothetical protein PC113_g12020 [Phytophthora cactorum]KAG2912702.1 hypothetical protein PC115_g12258 [Phytophthora cactorum]KAG2936459.1 hypothetical protein PC117_g12101 [Phytophthora cactorum]KAG3025138.1 hypothetical protein PC120_g6660 [Phytophthora cactorum]